MLDYIISHLDPLQPHPNLIRSITILFPNKVTSTDTVGQDFNLSFGGGDTIQPTPVQ